MKKTALAVAVSLCVGALAHAGTIRDNCGCGIGTMALGDQEATVLSQLAATFLNGLCGNQTFGITSGTLECDPAVAVVSNKKVIEFVADNMDHLAFDIARGDGESLQALADLMEVTGERRPAFYAALQQGFDQIFPAAEVTAEDVVANIASRLPG